MKHKESQRAVLVWQLNDLRQRFELKDREIIVGRSRSCDLALIAATVSRRHACIYLGQGEFLIKDLDSSYGTQINGEKIEPYQAFPLSPGDEIQFGRQIVYFQSPDNEAPVSQSAISTLNLGTGGMDFNNATANFEDQIHAEIEREIGQTQAARRLTQRFDRNFRQFKRHIEIKLREQEILQELAEKLSDILDVPTLLSTGLSLIMRVMNADRGVVLSLLKPTEGPVVSASHRYDSDSENDRYDLETAKALALDCLKNKECLIIEDALKDARYQGSGQEGIRACRSVVCFPLMAKDVPAEVIYLENLRTPGVFHLNQSPFLRAFGRQTAIFLKNARNFTHAITDDLTHLHKRHFLEKRLCEEMSRSRRHNRTCCVILIDLDGIKEINSGFGYGVGNTILKELARVIKQIMRVSDSAARFENALFSMLLPETDMEGAFNCATRLKRQFYGRPQPAAGPPIDATISLGIAGYRKEFGVDFEAFLKEADGALRQAKNRGKDQIFFAE